MTEDVDQPTDESTETPATETDATTQPVEEATETPAPVADEQPVEEAAPEPLADEQPVEEAATETPTPEPVADEQPLEEAAPAAPAPEPVAEEQPATPAAEPPQEARRKRKRLPRAQRRPRSKPKREQPSERKPIVRLPKPEHERGRRQERRGVVVSSAMDKTIVVKVESVKIHQRYKKVVRRATKFHAHDERNAAKVGDVVRIVETRPLSKTKHWRLAEIVEAAR